MQNEDRPARLLTDDELLRASQGGGAMIARFTPAPQGTTTLHVEHSITVGGDPDDDTEDLAALGIERGFSINSEDKAEWALNKLLEKDEQFARYEAQMKAKLAKLKADRDRFKAFMMPQLQDWADARRPDKLNPDKKKAPKYLDLDCGRVGFRDRARAAKVNNTDAAIAFIRDNAYLADMLALPETTFADVRAYMLDRPHFTTWLQLAIASQAEDGEAAAIALLRELVNPSLAAMVREETIFKLDGDALRAHALQSGELLPGVEFVDEGEDFYYKAPATKKSAEA